MTSLKQSVYAHHSVQMIYLCNYISLLTFFRDVGELNFENIEGFILNIPSDYKLAGFSIPFNFNRKHWIAIRKVGEEYYNLDSKLKCPELLGKESDAVRYLQDQLHEKERELLLIVTTEVAKNTSWRTEDEDQI